MMSRRGSHGSAHDEEALPCDPGTGPSVELRSSTYLGDGNDLGSSQLRAGAACS